MPRRYNPSIGGKLKVVPGRWYSSGSAGGGVTAAANLQHWWKMNEGSVVSATDYGLSADVGSDLIMSAVTSEAGGPSENGTPDCVDFDGSLGRAYTFLVDGSGVNTTVGDLIDVGYDWTFSAWFRDEATSVLTYRTWWQGGGGWSNGFGVTGVAPDIMKFFVENYAGQVASVDPAIPTSGWINAVVTFDRQSADNNYMKVYFASRCKIGAG